MKHIFLFLWKYRDLFWSYKEYSKKKLKIVWTFLESTYEEVQQH